MIPVIEEAALRRAVTPERAVSAIRAAFRADGEGRTHVPPVINLDIPAHRGEFHVKTAHIEGIRNGTFTSWTVDQYVGGFRGTPAPDEASRTRVIDVVDKSGTAAMVRATLKHGATTFTDYFVLLKVDGKWLIANKVYHAQR